MILKAIPAPPVTLGDLVREDELRLWSRAQCDPRHEGAAARWRLACPSERQLSPRAALRFGL